MNRFRTRDDKIDTVLFVVLGIAAAVWLVSIVWWALAGATP